MKKLKALMVTIMAIFLLTGVLGSNSLAEICYLPIISSAPPPPTVTVDQFIGSWAVADAEGATIGYLFIESDNTFVWADIPDKTAPHFSGTWSFTGDTLIAPFTNPGVGDGELVCTIAADGSMPIEFIEYWHSPAKHVPYIATKLNGALTVTR
jgi:hypothetical protein